MTSATGALQKLPEIGPGRATCSGVPCRSCRSCATPGVTGAGLFMWSPVLSVPGGVGRPLNRAPITGESSVVSAVRRTEPISPAQEQGPRNAGALGPLEDPLRRSVTQNIPKSCPRLAGRQHLTRTQMARRSTGTSAGDGAVRATRAARPLGNGEAPGRTPIPACPARATGRDAEDLGLVPHDRHSERLPWRSPARRGHVAGRGRHLRHARTHPLAEVSVSVPGPSRPWTRRLTCWAGLPSTPAACCATGASDGFSMSSACWVAGLSFVAP